MQGEELGTLLRHDRGQFLEFLSAYAHKKKGTEPKRSEELARDIARLLGGMANADGGTLLVGVESDKSVTGIPHTPDEVQVLIQAPQSLLSPPLHSSYERIHLGNLELLIFEVSPALEVHRVIGGRTFYRIAGDNLSIPAEQIQCLREAKNTFHYERQTIPEATWEDLDIGSIKSFGEKIGDLRDPKAILAQAYHLIDRSTQRPSLRMAALLLFAKDPAH
ncbi:MAG: ATP-binding protein [Deltaproteobacteria bacterium]|nr:ATP-binding protein [Deltaproteobacteria bacterium]